MNAMCFELYHYFKALRFALAELQLTFNILMNQAQELTTDIIFVLHYTIPIAMTWAAKGKRRPKTTWRQFGKGRMELRVGGNLRTVAAYCEKWESSVEALYATMHKVNR